MSRLRALSRQGRCRALVLAVVLVLGAVSWLCAWWRHGASAGGVSWQCVWLVLVLGAVSWRAGAWCPLLTVK